MVVVGGDFNADSVSAGTCAFSTDKGKTWTTSHIPPHGYRSCVEYLAKRYLVSCGLTGVDYSIDNAATWQKISDESFHVCRIAKRGTSVFLAGTNGKVARLVYEVKK